MQPIHVLQIKIKIPQCAQWNKPQGLTHFNWANLIFCYYYNMDCLNKTTITTTNSKINSNNVGPTGIHKSIILRFWTDDTIVS